MHVFVCITVTINGLINADVPHNTWVSKAAWKSYLERLQHTDVAIVGSKTYRVMTDKEFPPHLKYIVLSQHPEAISLRPNTDVSALTPTELIKQLEAHGHTQVGVLGGSEVISEFLEAGVIDELFVDVSSIVSGKGKNLVLPDIGVHRFELASVTQLDKQTAQMHYLAS